MQSSIYQSSVEKAAGNAMPLATESRLLFEAKFLPRAYYLAHMSIEDSANSILLRTMSVTGTSKIEILKVTKLFRDHKKKIEFLVSYAANFSEEMQAQLGELKGSLIDHINDLKNDKMYVSCKAESVVAPAEKVAAIDIERYVQFAEPLSQRAVSLLTPPSSRQPSAVAPIER
ncbi:AbiV family abortive infection protein [Delftia acidovorans]